MALALNLLVVVALGQAIAAGDRGQGSLDDWIAKRIETINGKDTRHYLETIHPAIVAAMNAGHKEYFESIVRNTIANEIPAKHTVEIIPLAPNGMLLFEDKLTYLIRPTHAVKVEHGTSGNDMLTRYWFAVEEAGNWYGVIGIPKDGRLGEGENN